MNNYLLFFSLFFPRITLYIAWLYHGIPPNTVPFPLEVVATIFLPRALVCYYIGTTLGVSNPWFVLHIIMWVFVWTLARSRYSNKG